MVEYLIGSIVAILLLLSIVNRYYYVETLGAFSNLDGLSGNDSKYVSVVSNYKGGLLRGTITFTLTVTNRTNVSDTQELTCIGHYNRQFPFYPIRFTYFKAENNTTGDAHRLFGTYLPKVSDILATCIVDRWDIIDKLETNDDLATAVEKHRNITSKPAFELVGNNADFSFQDCAMTNLKSKRGEITGDEFGTPSASTPSCIPKGNITTSYPSEFDNVDSDNSSSSSSSDSPSSD